MANVISNKHGQMTMRSTLFALMATITLGGCISTPATSLIFKEGERIEGTKNAIHEILICNPPKGLDWVVWGQFQLASEIPAYATDDSEADFTNHDALCYRITPRLEADTLRFRYMDRYIYSHSRLPMGFHLQLHGKQSRELPITYELLPVPESVPDSFQLARLALTDIVPQVKNIKLLEGTTPYRKADVSLLKGEKASWYRLTIHDTICIEAADPDGAYYAQVTLDKLRDNAGGKELPNLIIEDWPDFAIRPLMLDLGRNFLNVEQVCNIIDVMTRCKANMLMLHLAEDEGWRIEINGLPELTGFGAFHAIPQRQADGSYVLTDGLIPSQEGRVGREKPWQGSTGFYTRDEFKQILRYAAERHIEVVPELELPGHSGSAIEAMRYRARTTGDKSFLLTDENDKSQHTAVYGYRDNIMDVSLPSVYNFLEIVLDDLIAMYKETGLTLQRVNLSGDEVPEGCWMESPSAKQLMAENNMRSTADLWTYFLNRVTDIYASKGLKLIAYTEVLHATDSVVKEKLKQQTAFLINWYPTTRANGDITRQAYKYVEMGFPVLFSNADYTYMDNVYSFDRREHGLCWAGATDERKAYSYNSFDALGERIKLEHPENVIGVEPMLWGDNVYNFEQACYLLFPKVFSLFERSWNAIPDTSEIAFGKFYSIVTTQELPYLESKQLNHRDPMQAKIRQAERGQTCLDYAETQKELHEVK